MKVPFCRNDITHRTNENTPSSLIELKTEYSCVSAATPYPGGFKCFTCQDAVDNYDCNRWAPDVYCPKGTSAFDSSVAACSRRCQFK